MATGDIIMVPVDSQQHLHCLREYRELLQSSMGPQGSCKAVVTGGGYLSVTCSCSTISARLELANPVCKYINNMAAGRVNYGFYSAALLSHMLELLYTQSSKNNSVKLIMDLAEQLKTLLFSEHVCVKLSFDSIQNLVPVVRTVITSKCSPLHSGMDVDKLCLELIKAFLNCVDEETNAINRIYLKVENGLNHHTSCKGLVYTVTENHNVEIVKNMGEVKILVFESKLESNELVNDHLLEVLDHAIQRGVKIFACQQIISSEIKIFLRRNNAMFLERMGSDFTKMLIYISHAFPISQLNMNVSEVENFAGSLSSVEYLRCNSRNHFVLHNENRPVSTVMVQTSSLLGEESVKILITQALAALRVVAAHPLLTLGGGCLETWLIGQIHQIKEGRKDVEFHRAATLVQKAFSSTCFASELDTLYHHSWREGQPYCGCRMLERGVVEKEGAAWITLKEVTNCELTLPQSRQPSLTLRPDTVVEPQQPKLQAICDVFEVFANLRSIGLIVQQV